MHPDSQDPRLGLRHPTEKECRHIWSLELLSWRDSLDEQQYFDESAYMLIIPLAKDGGMTLWILTDTTLPPDQRPILCSCQTFVKRTLVSDPDGNLSEKNIHAVASVFTDPALRRRGYCARLMRELATVLRTFRFDATTNVGSVLYSDIGPRYYADLGWHPFPNNSEIVLKPREAQDLAGSRSISHDELDQLCRDDEVMARKALSEPSKSGKTRICVIPDLDHMLWHHCKADFAANINFGEIPKAKGAVAGEPGDRIWAIWTHRWYDKPDAPDAQNTLYVLRLVVENEQGKRVIQADQMKALLQAMQAEACKWKLQDVKIWDPSPLVQYLVRETGIEHEMVHREEESLASLYWFGEGSGKDDEIEWVANEHYAWL
jgi:hypothetical protein